MRLVQAIILLAGFCCLHHVKSDKIDDNSLRGSSDKLETVNENHRKLGHLFNHFPNPKVFYPLGLCEGHCRTDENCYGELKCFHRSDSQPVPGCQGEGVSGDNYCYLPEDASVPRSGPYTAAPTPAPDELFKFPRSKGNIPFDACRGDCDDDFECKPGLLCFKRKKDESVPGCWGEGVFGFDYCFDPRSDPGPTASPGPRKIGTDPPSRLKKTRAPRAQRQTRPPTGGKPTVHPGTSCYDKLSQSDIRRSFLNRILKLLRYLDECETKSCADKNYKMLESFRANLFKKGKVNSSQNELWMNCDKESLNSKHF